MRTRGDLTTPEEFAAIIVTQSENDVVRLGDVAEVAIGAEDERTVARYNGQPAVGLGIVKQSKASTIDVAARRARRAARAVAEPLPEGMRLDVAYDSSTFIEDSIHEVTDTLLIAMCLVVLVILVFLKSFRATMIPTIAIPISIIGTFAVAYFLGFTINILTLLALVLAIGLVVDDAIVVLENIFRHMEMGKRTQAGGVRRLQGDRLRRPRDDDRAGRGLRPGRLPDRHRRAALQGVRHLGGGRGADLGIRRTDPDADALLADAAAAARRRHGLDDPLLRRLLQLPRSRRTSRRCARRSAAVPLVVAAAVALIVVSVGVFKLLPRELVPTEDRGIAFGIVIAPEGSTLDYTDRYMRQVEAILLPLPERNGLFTAIGSRLRRARDGHQRLRLPQPEAARRARRSPSRRSSQELFPQL